MRIQKRILLSVAASVAISLVIVFIVFSVLRELDNEAARRKIYREIGSKIYALNMSIARLSSLPHPSRTRQIKEIQGSLEILLGTIAPLGAGEEFLIRQIKTNSEELQYSLEKLISGSMESKGAMDAERYNVLVSQLWMKTQFISDDIQHLITISQSRIESSRRRARILIPGLIVALMLINAGISFFSGRSIARAQQALNLALAKAEEGDRMLSALMEYVPEGITMADRELNLTRVSRYGQRLLGDTHEGMSAEEVASQWNVYHADGKSPMAVEDLPLVRAVRRGEVVHDAEIVQINASGDRLPLLCTAGPIRDDAGVVIGGIVAWRDISDRKHAEEAVRAREVDLSEAQRVAHIGSWHWDAQTDITTGTDELLRIYGFDPATQTIPNFKDQRGLWYPPEEWDRLNAAVQESARTGAGYDIEVQALRNGRCIWVQTRSETVCDAEGRIVGLHGTVQDITEHKRAEEALRQGEERLRASLGEKEVLLKEIHHRVKNNMQVISSLLALQADELQDTAMRSILRDVTHRVRSMAMVHEKLYQSTDLARVEFADYARSLLNYLWRAHGAAASGVGLDLDLEPVLLPVNEAVPCGLILNELFSNALKHAFSGRDGGQVAVSLRGDTQRHVRLSVRDNGAGLPPGMDWGQTRSLGLRLVQMLAGQLRADVEVTSDKGTEFTITFERLET
ncbi:MAG: PAS domain S-box protein [Deltaproteobacteria bacterium]|nr:PAS domain S-box protein [Deltaproteobacteria bacterium]